MNGTPLVDEAMRLLADRGHSDTQVILLAALLERIEQQNIFLLRIADALEVRNQRKAEAQLKRIADALEGMTSPDNGGALRVVTLE